MAIEIKGREQVYKGWTTLHRLTLSDGKETFTREVEDHGSAVGVLPYDPERRVVLMVRMPRGPVLQAGQTDILEIPAGLLEPGESPEAAARREAAEETGLNLGALELVGTFWTSPGISTERITLFLAAYHSGDRVGPGGGLAQEHENISVLELSIQDAVAEMDRGQAVDMRVYTLLQALRLRRPDLF
jgi:nudix-type nucleoside diphosphatase (YffH/AdpP family)